MTKYFHPAIIPDDEASARPVTSENTEGGTSVHPSIKSLSERWETAKTASLAMPTLRQSEKREEVIDVKTVLEENDKRWARLTLEGINQFTGEGIEGHTNKVSIQGFTAKPLYVTDELLNESPLWGKCSKIGSVDSYVEYWNAAHPDAPIDTDDVVGRLLKARMKYDVYFAFATCFYIQDKISGHNIPFRLNYAQLILVERFEEMRRAGQPIRLILLKARQWGGSTVTQLYMAWVQLFHKVGWNSVIIAQTKDTARRIKGMYSRVLKNFPADVVYGIKEIKFSPKEKSTADFTITDEGGGVVIRDNVITVASYENYESTRGANFAMMHGSEVAYWTETVGKSAESLMTSVNAGLVDGPLTLEVLESTANGMAGYFYDEYQLAKSGASSRQALFIAFFHILNDTKPFTSDKERVEFAQQLINNRNETTNGPTSESGEYLWSLWEKGASLEGINWYVQKRRSFHDHESMAQEAPSDDIECFKHSGHTIFSQYLVDKYCKEYASQPIYRGDVVSQDGKMPRLSTPTTDGELFIWQYPDRDNQITDRYMSVVDVGGRGSKSDFSVITVVDRMPIMYGGKAEVVARWRGHIRYDFLASKAVLLSRLYCDAFLVFESNTFDKKDAQSTEFTYEGDHTRGILQKVEGEYSNLYMRASTNPEDIRNGRYKKIGFQTNVKTKQDIVDAFLVSFEDNTDFQDPDERAYQEMAIYEQREDGSYGNIPGKNNHDDILMTDMIANFISLRQMPLPTKQIDLGSASWDKGTVNESLL